MDPYRKWQGPHWSLYSLAEIGYPPGDQGLLPMRQRKGNPLVTVDALWVLREAGRSG